MDNCILSNNRARHLSSPLLRCGLWAPIVRAARELGQNLQSLVASQHHSAEGGFSVGFGCVFGPFSSKSALYLSKATGFQKFDSPGGKARGARLPAVLSREIQSSTSGSEDSQIEILPQAVSGGLCPGAAGARNPTKPRHRGSRTGSLLPCADGRLDLGTRRNFLSCRIGSDGDDAPSRTQTQCAPCGALLSPLWRSRSNGIEKTCPSAARIPLAGTEGIRMVPPSIYS